MTRQLSGRLDYLGIAAVLAVRLNGCGAVSALRQSLQRLLALSLAVLLALSLSGTVQFYLDRPTAQHSAELGASPILAPAARISDVQQGARAHRLKPAPFLQDGGDPPLATYCAAAANTTTTVRARHDRTAADNITYVASNFDARGPPARRCGA